MPHGLEIEGWSRDLDDLGVWLGRHFLRSEPRRRALAYLRGLMAPLERKNGWQLGRGGWRSDAGRDAGIFVAGALGCGSGPR